MALKTYDAREVTVIFHGIPISGVADGSFVKVSRQNDSFELVLGADGEAVRSAFADDSGEIEITLSQGSASNDYLSAELALDELTRNNTGPSFVRDGFGTTRVSGDSTYIKKPADVDFDKSVGERTWTIVVPHMKIFVGGLTAS